MIIFVIDTGSGENTILCGSPTKEKDMDKDNMIKRLRSDFHYDFDFKSIREVNPPARDTMIRIKTRYYMRLEAFARFKIKDIEDPDARFRGVLISMYRDALLHKSIVLRFDPPCFDSGDRQYDSRHTLYLVHSLTDISAVYCVEGYEVSELYVFEGMTAVSEKLLGYLREAGFPVGRLKAL